MKIKRWLSTIMAMCIFMSLITCMPVSAAAQEWTYCLKVQISDAKDSKSKDGNIKGYLYFNGEDEEVFTLQNTKTSGEMSETTHTSSRAPWTLDKVTIENVTTDAFKILYVSLGVAKKGSDSYRWIIDEIYPDGTGTKDGLWIEKNKKRSTTYKSDGVMRMMYWKTVYGRKNQCKRPLLQTVKRDMFLLPIYIR